MRDLAELLARDLTRLLQELDAFPDDASSTSEATLWRTVPGIANSAGNLMLHLEGNLRHYIGYQLGGIAYTRDRPREFSNKNIPRAELTARFAELREIIPPIIAGLSPERLDAEHPVPELGRPHTTRQFLLHLFGHFEFHLGQIGYLRRVLTEDGAVPFVTLSAVKEK